MNKEAYVVKVFQRVPALFVNVVSVLYEYLLKLKQDQCL